LFNKNKGINKMKKLIFIGLLMSITMSSLAREKRDYFICSGYENDDSGLVVAGETKDYFAFIQLHGKVQRVAPEYPSKNASGEKIIRWDFGGEGWDDWTIGVRKGDYGYVASLYDFTTELPEGENRIAVQSWQCARR